MIYQAELMGFIRTVLIIIFIFYLIRILGRYLMPFLLKVFARKVQKNFENQFQNNYQRQNPNKQTTQKGDVTITYDKKKPKSTNEKDDYGDYVEFEDVND